jgi:hypothetical protein
MDLKKLFPTTTFAERLRTSALLFVCVLVAGILLAMMLDGQIGKTVSILVFTVLVLFIARRLKICRSQAWLFGYLVTAKVFAVFKIGPHLALFEAIGFTNTTWFWLVIALGLVAWWTAAEGQSLTIRRVFSISALAMTCWMADQWLGPYNVIDGPLDSYFWSWEARSFWVDPSDYFRDFFESVTFYLFFWVVISSLVYLVSEKEAPESSMFNNLGHRAIVHGAKLGGFALFFGAIGACILVGLFSANNTYIITEVMPHYYMPIEDLPWLDFKRTVALPYGQSYEQFGQNRLLYHILQFDFQALKSALMGIWKSAPFIALGCGLAWIAGKVRLTGLLPILAIGAICGFGWHLAYPTHGYWTPFMNITQSAMLIGMIAASAFGAIAQFFPERREAGLEPLLEVEQMA